MAIALLALVAWGVGWYVHDGRHPEAEIGVTDEPSPRRGDGERSSEAEGRRAYSRGASRETAEPAATALESDGEVPAAEAAPAADR